MTPGTTLHLRPHPLVLIVETDAASRERYAQVLLGRGYAVAHAHNGSQAMELVRHLAPDIVVTDLELPGIDGRELCRRVKAEPALGEIPVIALADKSVPPWLLNHPGRREFESILVKPYRTDMLLETIDRCLIAAVAAQENRLNAQPADERASRADPIGQPRMAKADLGELTPRRQSVEPH